MHQSPRRNKDWQRRASQKSPFRHPGGQDKGQRFVVSYRDGVGTPRDFGFCDTEERAKALLAKAAARWPTAIIRDRKLKLSV